MCVITGLFVKRCLLCIGVTVVCYNRSCCEVMFVVYRSYCCVIIGLVVK